MCTLLKQSSFPILVILFFYWKISALFIHIKPWSWAIDILYTCFLQDASSHVDQILTMMPEAVRSPVCFQDALSDVSQKKDCRSTQSMEELVLSASVLHEGSTGNTISYSSTSGDATACDQQYNRQGTTSAQHQCPGPVPSTSARHQCPMCLKK